MVNSKRIQKNIWHRVFESIYICVLVAIQILNFMHINVDVFFLVICALFNCSHCVILQDDTYTDSYISTIGVDFVSI